MGFPCREPNKFPYTNNKQRLCWKNNISEKISSLIPSFFLPECWKTGGVLNVNDYKKVYNLSWFDIRGIWALRVAIALFTQHWKTRKAWENVSGMRHLTKVSPCERVPMLESDRRPWWTLERFCRTCRTWPLTNLPLAKDFALSQFHNWSC